MRYSIAIAIRNSEAVVWRRSVEKVFIEISQACNFIKKAALAQVFSCEFCEISKNAFFTEHLRWLLLEIANLRPRNIYIYFAFSKLFFAFLINFCRLV